MTDEDAADAEEADAKKDSAKASDDKASATNDSVNEPEATAPEDSSDDFDQSLRDLGLDNETDTESPTREPELGEANPFRDDSLQAIPDLEPVPPANTDENVDDIFQLPDDIFESSDSFEPRPDGTRSRPVLKKRPELLSLQPVAAADKPPSQVALTSGEFEEDQPPPPLRQDTTVRNKSVATSRSATVADAGELPRGRPRLNAPRSHDGSPVAASVSRSEDKQMRTGGSIVTATAPGGTDLRGTEDHATETFSSADRTNRPQRPLRVVDSPARTSQHSPLAKKVAPLQLEARPAQPKPPAPEIDELLLDLPPIQMTPKRSPRAITELPEWNQQELVISESEQGGRYEPVAEPIAELETAVEPAIPEVPLATPATPTAPAGPADPVVVWMTETQPASQPIAAEQTGDRVIKSDEWQPFAPIVDGHEAGSGGTPSAQADFQPPRYATVMDETAMERSVRWDPERAMEVPVQIHSPVAPVVHRETSAIVNDKIQTPPPRTQIRLRKSADTQALPRIYRSPMPTARYEPIHRSESLPAMTSNSATTRMQLKN